MMLKDHACSCSWSWKLILIKFEIEKTVDEYCKLKFISIYLGNLYSAT